MTDGNFFRGLDIGQLGFRTRRIGQARGKARGGKLRYAAKLFPHGGHPAGKFGLGTFRWLTSLRDLACQQCGQAQRLPMIIHGLTGRAASRIFAGSRRTL